MDNLDLIKKKKKKEPGQLSQGPYRLTLSKYFYAYRERTWVTTSTHTLTWEARLHNYNVLSLDIQVITNDHRVSLKYYLMPSDEIKKKNLSQAHLDRKIFNGHPERDLKHSQTGGPSDQMVKESISSNDYYDKHILQPLHCMAQTTPPSSRIYDQIVNSLY